ncbi:MAG: hypothetical protein PHN39_03770, partial [Candidatus Pacebacteria bacterium]|nr:hypothetical protein [Candidatus Paceibacterota bacterium]
MEPQFGEQKFNIEANDLAALQERIAKLEAQLSGEKQEVGQEAKVEMAKQEIKEYVQEVQQTPSFAPPVSTRNDADDIKDKSATEQVGALVSLALSSGVSKAIHVAQDLNNPAILDELHDTLI